LFRPDEHSGRLRADFESEPYFGAGWGDATRTPTGAVRHARRDAALFLPLEQGHSYRVFLDLTAEEAVDVSLALNGSPVGACDPHAARSCELLLPSAAVHHGVNTLLLSVPGGELTRSRVLTFRGAGISRVR
jgi:hypothetical protein